MQQPWYATREQVKRALDSAETARNNAQVDRAITAASRSIEQLCHRTFHPFDGTRYIGFPERNANSSWRIWLDQNDLISLSTLVSGGTTISASDYFLEPVDSGPPYTSIEVDLSSSATFAGGDTWQRSIALTGTFGYWDEQEEVGTLSEALAATVTDAANVDFSNMDSVGVGSILKINSERLIITDKTFVDTFINTGNSLTASAAAVSITVADTDEFFPGEVIRVDSERMLVVDTGTVSTITVKRAWDGSVLAAHSTAADIYANTGIQTSRAQLGSVLAAHTADAVVYRYVVPTLINDLCIAEALAQLQGEQSAYAREGGGTGESAFGPAGKGLSGLRNLVRASFGRKARLRTI